MLRQAVFAGRFYPDDKNTLTRELAKYVKETSKKQKAVGIVSPHAGYIYSGSIAGEIYSKIKMPERYIILSPNHTGIGSRISLYGEGSWQTPLGEVNVDKLLAGLIASKFDAIKPDVSAHMMEHSLEVQIPFIQYLKDDFEIVPITIGHISVNECKKLGTALAESIRETKKETLIVSSSDMTHYESAKTAKEKDNLAIERIQALDPEGLIETVRANGITMCGVIPTTVLLFAAKELGAKKGTLVKYGNSGDVSGDYDEVVGYAGLYVN